MKHWNIGKLSDLCILKRGYDLPIYAREQGNVPIYSSSGISGYHNESKCISPGVITGRYGTIGTVFFAKDDFWPLNTTLFVENFNGNDEKFIYYFLKTLEWEKYNDKSAVPGINRNDVHKETIYYPDVKEQKAIAAVLGSLDDKIDLLQRQNATLEAMAETLFRQWFIEEAQEDWDEHFLSSIVDIKSGFAFKSSTFTESGKFYLVTIKAVQDGYLTLVNADRLDSIPAKMKEYCLLKKGDILLSLTGNIGRCCMVDRDNLLLNQRVALLSPRQQRDWAAIYTLFRLSSFKNILIDMGKGTAQSNLSPIETSNMTLLLPEQKVFDKFSKIATPLLNKFLNNRYQIRTLEKLRDTLLPKLMSGEVRIRVDE